VYTFSSMADDPCRSRKAVVNRRPRSANTMSYQRERRNVDEVQALKAGLNYDRTGDCPPPQDLNIRRKF